MISHKYKCIFVHIPKCGGSSIERIIWPQERSESDLWMGFVSKYTNKYQTGGLQHLFASHIRNEVGDRIFKEYYKFAFTRNPWDKAISQFVFMNSREDLREFIGMKRGESFKRYLELIQKKNHVQWDQQHRFLTDERGTLLVDFVGRFENIERDALLVTARLGIAANQIPHENRTVHAPYFSYYDLESIEMVRSIYKADIEMFGYRFPSRGEQLSAAKEPEH